MAHSLPASPDSPRARPYGAHTGAGGTIQSPGVAEGNGSAQARDAGRPQRAERAWRRRLRVWGGLTLVWTVLALLSVAQRALFQANIGRPFELGPAIIASFIDWYTCAVFTPAILWIAYRFPIDRAHWARSVPIHLIATSVMVVLKYVIYGKVRVWLDGPTAPTLETLLARSFISESIAFWATMAVAHAYAYYRRYRERELHAARLQTQLVEARLDALSAQLRPHFLFNALHGVSTLMHRDVDAADAMLTRLGDLLRLTLRTADRHELRLAEELDLLEHYVELIRIRFQDRLTIERRVPDDVLGAQVPPFILQPLVENAVEHGIARRAGAGRIEISAERRGDSLLLQVTDDGAGLRRGAEDFPSEGIGLSNTRRRLAELYGSRQRLEFEERRDGSGLRVSLWLPFRAAAADSPAAREPMLDPVPA